MNSCLCGNSKLDFMEKCPTCTMNDILSAEEITNVGVVDFEKVNVFVLPIFININYEKRLLGIQKVINNSKLSEFVYIEKTDKTFEYKDKNYSEFLMFVKNDYDEEVLNYVLSMLTISKARSYDFNFSDYDDVSILRYITNDMTPLQIRALNILFLRYKNNFIQLTKAGIYGFNFLGTITDDLRNKSFDEVIEKIGLQCIVEDDNKYIISLGRGTFNANSLINIFKIYLKVFEIAKSLNAENIKEFKTPLKFFDKVIENDDNMKEFVFSRCRIDNSVYNENLIKEYFGSYDYSDYDYDEDEDY